MEIKTGLVDVVEACGQKMPIIVALGMSVLPGPSLVSAYLNSLKHLALLTAFSFLKTFFFLGFHDTIFYDFLGFLCWLFFL